MAGEESQGDIQQASWNIFSAVKQSGAGWIKFPKAVKVALLGLFLDSRLSLCLCACLDKIYDRPKMFTWRFHLDLEWGTVDREEEVCVAEPQGNE